MIRPMLERDLDTITALEKQHQLHPWPRSGFEQAMRLGQYCIVYEAKGHMDEYIEGYGIAQGGHGRLIFAATVEAAHALYAAWFARARELRVPLMWAQIEPDNRAARLRLKRFGFAQVGQVPHLYGPGTVGEVWQRSVMQDNKAEQGATPPLEAA